MGLFPLAISFYSLYALKYKQEYLCGMFLKYTDSIKFSRKYNADFYINKASKEISRYDKSSINRETRRSYC